LTLLDSCLFLLTAAALAFAARCQIAILHQDSPMIFRQPLWPRAPVPAWARFCTPPPPHLTPLFYCPFTFFCFFLLRARFLRIAPGRPNAIFSPFFFSAQPPRGPNLLFSFIRSPPLRGRLLFLSSPCPRKECLFLSFFFVSISPALSAGRDLPPSPHKNDFSPELPLPCGF